MTKPKIAIYIQKRYAKPTYKTESYDVRAWPGIEMVKDDLERRGYPVGYCDRGTVADYDIILMSITAACDWYPFIAERVKWAKGDYKVLMGGAGLLNVRPFLEYFDAVVFGRAEGLTHLVIDSLMGGYEMDNPSVCYAQSFSMDKRYEVRQVDKPYPHEYRLPRGDNWQETASGCKRKCLFCQYAFSRRYMSRDGDISGEYNHANVNEATIFDFDLAHPDTWTRGGRGYIIVGLDGTSERLRFMANKPITDDLLRDFIIASIAAPGVYRVKMFNIVGLPTESPGDWERIVDVFAGADEQVRVTGDDRERYVFEITNNHFNTSFPAPFAVMPARYENLRWLPADTVRRSPLKNVKYRHKVFDGRLVRLLFMHSTETLPTVALTQASYRGIEKDAPALRKIACSRKYWNANTATRKATLESVLDVDRLFGCYTWETLPTRYLHTYVPYEGMAKMSDHNLRKYGGDEGVKIADMIAGVIPGAY